MVGACSLPLLVRVLVSEPVWLSGKVSERDVGSNPLRLSFLFKKLWSEWTLSCDFVPHN